MAMDTPASPPEAMATSSDPSVDEVATSPHPADGVLPWRVVRQEIVYQDRWRTLRRDYVQIQDGSDSNYVFLETNDSVFVVPQLAGGRIVLLRQYRHPLRAWAWEVPAGGIEPDETPAQAAARELREEIGGEAQTWRFLGRFPTAVAHVTDWFSVYLAQGVTLGQRQPELHEVAEVQRSP